MKASSPRILLATIFAVLVWNATSFSKKLSLSPRKQKKTVFPLADDASTSCLVVVDFENVRGKSAFQLTHENLLSRSLEWYNTKRKDKTYSEQTSLALVVDHGAIQCTLFGGTLNDRGGHIGVIFSGPGTYKADDVIVTVVGERSCGSDVVSSTNDNTNVLQTIKNKTVVVTADSELISRCQRARKTSAINSDVLYVDPVTFLAELRAYENADLQGFFGEDARSLGTTEQNSYQATQNDAASKVRREMLARQELLAIERKLGARGKQRGVSRKKRTKLKSQREKARERLKAAILASTSSGAPTFHTLVDSESDATPSGEDQPTLDDMVELMKATKNSMPSKRRSVESTYDRCILAERLRRRLEASSVETVDRIHPLDWIKPIEAQIVDNQEVRVCSKSANTLGAVDEEKSLVRSKPSADRVTVETPEKGQTLPDTPLTHESIKDVDHRSAFVVPCRQHIRNGETSTKSLRIVVISDTHGFESQLRHLPGPDEPSDRRLDMLPPADVLVHCGDFSNHKGKRAANKLDTFLASQTHIHTKIVVRGNHDSGGPAKLLFPRSNALYATETSVVTVQGVQFCLMPFTFKRIPPKIPECDVLVSHLPPFGVQDRTYQMTHAGSMSLRRAVENSPVKPRLWLCGHIHEARGASVEHFCSNGKISGDTAAAKTLVVNAANANAGRAKRLTAGSMLVDVDYVSSRTEERTDGIGKITCALTGLLRDDSLEALALKESSSETNDPNRNLLAVDLGLKTATAHFDANGQFQEVNTWNFANPDELEAAIPKLIANATHIVVEGINADLYALWSRATFPHQKMVRVRAEDWRRALLLPREHRNAQQSKAAARLVARQIVGETANTGRKGSPIGSTDAAEAIMVGYHAIRELKWGDTSGPAVKRYSNGNIIR